MMTQPILHHCEYPTGHELREAIQCLGLPRHAGSSDKGTPIHYVLKHVWNRMPRRFAPRDDGLGGGIQAFHSRPFADKSL